MKSQKVLRIVGLLVFLSGGITWAQVNTGTISGTVKDTTGQLLPGAKAVVLNQGTGISRTVETDASGRYKALSLSLGNYQVTVSHEGFRTEVRSGIELTVGQEAVVDSVLAVGAVTQTVEVTGAASLVDTTTSSLGSLVDDRTIRDLPLNGRSYDQLALLQPGVTLSSPGQTSNTTLLFGSGKRFSVGGQRDVSNSFLLDGTNIADQGNGTPGGAAGTNLGVDTILEFKIFTSAFKAEYGRSTGSVVSSVTRSGTNTFQGTVFEYIRNSAVDTKNFFDVGSSPPSFRRNQFGGVLGGPIKKDRTFFFGGYEGLRQALATTLIATVPTALARQGILPTAVGATTTVTVPVNPVVVPYLNLYPLPNGRDFGDGTAEFRSSPLVPTNEDNFMVRVDHQLNEKTSIFGRYTFDNDSVDAPQSLPDLFVLTTSRRQYSTLQANSILNPKVLNNFRFAFNRTGSSYSQVINPDPGPQLSIVPGQPLGAFVVGAISQSGARAITPLGSASGNGPSLWAYNIFEWGDDLSYIDGRHSLKFGTDIERLEDNTTLGQALRGTYAFNTFNTFLAGTPASLQVNGPLGIAPAQSLRQSMFSVYGQDDYTVNSRLTLNLGVRWEISTDPIDANGHMAILPSPSATSTVISDRFFSVGKNNFGPRFGLVWKLNDSGKTAVRASGGIYYSLILPWVYSQQIKQPPFYGKLSVSNPPFPNGYQLIGSLSATGNGKLQIAEQDPFDKTPVADIYNVSIEQQLSNTTVVQVAYAGNHANHFPYQIQLDTPIPTICPAAPCPSGLPSGTEYFPAGAPLRNPAWKGIRDEVMGSNSDYNSVTVTLRRNSHSGFRGQIFYTFSKAMDESSSTAGADSTDSPSGVLDSNDPARDWGLSDYNVKHSVVGTFSYSPPFRADSKALGTVVNGWTLDGIATFQSGHPFTALLSTSQSMDDSTVLADRPNLNPGFSTSPTNGISSGCSGFIAGTPVRNANNWYDPCAFSLPVAGTYGSLGRNTIIGPGLEDVDLALEKGFNLRDKAKAMFRFEMFNIMNHTNLGLPNTTALAASGAANPSAGRITYTTTSSRQIQLALRISF